METIYKKTMAVGAVLAICLTAFAGMAALSDESDATVSGSADNPLDELHVNYLSMASSSSGDEVIYLKKGAAISFREDGQPADEADGYSYYSGTDFERFVSEQGLSKTFFNDEGPYNVYLYEGTVNVIGDYSFTELCCSSWWEDETTLATEDDGNPIQITIYVVETSITHTVTYSANGGTGTTASTVVTDTNSGSSNVTLAACGFSKAGYNFAGWKVGNTIYQPGQMVSVAANTSVNAVAQWTPIPVNITSSGDDADIVVGNSFSRAITTDVAGTTISFTGPSWLTMSGSTLVGTPSVAGDYTVTVNATNGVSSDSQTFGIHVV
ncbi:MAG: InlB B-repeat-containing protein, partial [Candidatus Methanomethylophilus sp.]|nr:InlB B-repeat-containing protein [Methanomethylophilus sp.]